MVEAMNEFVDISKTYQGVRTALSSALKDLDGVTVSDEEGNKHLTDVRSTLADMDANFGKEIAYLEKHADWQNFTVAFFGETNAGKSTIIESLRIIMEEQSRASRLHANATEVAASEAKFAREAEGLIRDLHAGYEDYEVRVADLAAQVKTLATSSRRAQEAAQLGIEQAKNETMKMAQELAVAQHETARAIHQAADTLRLGAKRFWVGLVVGVVAGAVAGAAIGMLFH
jgi:DNA repair ATPase RecN